MSSRMYLHVDLDAFFASVEVLDNPELKGKPLIVGGLPGERRSVVSTCSYEARKYGVHSAMPISRAYELCPHAIFVHGRMERYHEKSQEVMSVFKDFSPDVMQMSVDEAFIDITGTEMLFGPPETLAKTLKQRVLDKTGLTVSVGIATNRYVAKIASGMKKPDGLCYVPEGKEEDFMLSLPLDKLWGIGTKSRERLNGCGIFSIPEIHAISETALKELFGEASGSFLYKSVRGMDVEHFGDETKSRSFSAERTFCFDLSDIYSIETELLHLSYDVMFRVLHEKVNSRTVCLKIRYEDFTTVTVTESSTRIVSSIEDLFERSCRLFHKKYERGRGIRLLGLGLQNLNNGLESEQGELFDFGEKKQRSVEKTVLKLHQKNPATKLKKARQFITSVMAVFFLLGSLSPLHADNIEFEVEGSWESLLSGSATVYLGDDAPVLSMQSPVFTQKADMFVWFMYDNHWYFDASVSTETDTNKIAAGYIGDGIIQEVRIGTDIGTEDISPGIRLSLQGSNWDADTQIHLDSVQMHTKTWKGSNEIISSSIPLASFKKGMLFSAINSAIATQITGLYVEDNAGSYTDDSFRRYKRLSRDEYLILPAKGLIYLGTSSEGAVIAEISDKPAVETALPDFLTDVFDWFGDRSSESLYSVMGPFFTAVTSGSEHTSQGLYLSKPGTFSPFQVSSLYDDTFQNTSGTITVSERSLYADYSFPVLLNESSALIQLHSSESLSASDFTSASVRFPAAKLYPELYLPSNGVVETSAPNITTTTSQLSESFSIGSKAIENSVRAMKNGIVIPSSYDRSTGNVTLSVPYSATDTITLSWNEYSAGSEETTLSFGTLVHHFPTPYLTTTGSLDSTLFIDTDTHSFSSSSESPYASASLETKWERPFGKVTLSASNTLTADGTFGISGSAIPVLSFSGGGNEAVWLLDGVKISDTVPVLASRTSNQSPANPTLSEDKRQSLTLESKKISQKTGYSVTIDGSLSENGGGSPSWYAVDIPLSAEASSIPSSHVFSFSMQDLSRNSSAYDVYLKLGDATWLISAQDTQSAAVDVLVPFVHGVSGFQDVRVLLTDSDRLKIETNHDMSIVIVNKSNNSATPIKIELKGNESAVSGLFFNVSSYNATGSSIHLPVTVTEVPFPIPYTEKSWLFSSDNIKTAARISWDTSNAPSGSSIRIERNLQETSFSRYQSLSAILYIPESDSATDITINLQKLTDSGYVTSSSLSMAAEELAPYKGNWHTVTVPLSSNDVISKVQFIINAHPSSECPDEDIYIGGIFISDPVSVYTGSDKVATSLRYSSDKLIAELYTSATGSGSYSDCVDETALSSEVRAVFDTSVFALSGNGIFDMQNASLISGDYTISTGDRFLSGTIDFSDTSNFSVKTDESYRKDALTLSLVPLNIPFSAGGIIETERKGSDMSGKNVFTVSSEYPAGKTSASFITEQSQADAQSFSYSGTADAGKRTETASMLQKLIFWNGSFSPSLEAGFSAISDKKQTENSGSFSQKLTFPFLVNSNTISFSYKRETSSAYVPSHNSVSFLSDIKNYAESFSIHYDSLSIMPLYDLFSDTIGETLQTSLFKSPLTSRSTYNASASLTWMRPLNGNTWDLLIPNSASVTLDRLLSQAGLNTLDKKKKSLFLAYTAFNCLGAASAKPVFTWYQQDEFQYSVRLTIEPEKTKTEINSYGTLYFEDDAHITSVYTGTFCNDSSFDQVLQFSWNRPARLFNKEAEQITAGTVEVKKVSSSENSECRMEVSHKADIYINENFSVNGKAAFGSSINTTTALNITLYFGAKYVF